MGHKRMSLSVSMIVKNEEKHLPRCLASLQGLADEIVLVDTGSTDSTVAIATEFGAKVFHHVWADDFAKARNASLAHCTGDWILVVDADEAIDPVDHTGLRSLLADHGPAAFRMRCRNYVTSATQTILDATPVRNTSPYATGREFAYYVDYVIHTRLFRRLPDVQFSGRIHEVVDPYFESRGLPIGISPAILHHFGKLDLERESSKKDFYLGLCEKEARLHPNNHLNLLNLIIQSKTAQKWSLCLRSVEKFVSIRENVPPLVFMAAATSQFHLGDTPAAASWLEKALSVDASHTEALTLKARCLAAERRLEEACFCLERAIAIQPSYVVPHINLAEIKVMEGKPQEAREALLRGIGENPKEEILYTKLVLLDCHQGHRYQAASSAARALSALPSGGDGLWHRLVVAHLLESGDFEGASAIVELGTQAFPKNPTLVRLKAICAAQTSPAR